MFFFFTILRQDQANNITYQLHSSSKLKDGGKDTNSSHKGE